MNPSYKVQIDIVLKKPVEDQNIFMRRIQYLPYVPRDNDTIRISNEDESDTVDLTMDGVVYDAANGIFLVTLEDETLIEEYKEQGRSDDKAAVESYKAYGFIRLNFPTAQALHAITSTA